MGMYRIEWDCCGSVTETDGYLPHRCPICERDDLVRLPARTAARLTDEQIEVIEMDQWNRASVTRDGFDREAFARAIETAVLKANGLEGQQ